jgi:hypothetical protein
MSAATVSRYDFNKYEFANVSYKGVNYPLLKMHVASHVWNGFSDRQCQIMNMIYDY